MWLAYFPWAKVLMLKPRVGLTDLISSPFIFLRMVVFPALSSPLEAINKAEVCTEETKDELAETIFSFLSLSVCFFL